MISTHHRSSRWDFIAVVQTRSLAEFNNVLNDVRSIDGIKSTESNLLLDSMIF
ncbi:Lrp/AsnC ligand binding domain-containing protein [Marinomonas phaeophyticola]|uniref:Lrp/AsnC ligand binding domain-containing protein n=1 Tax=Marinomonas phaeophyticola TaxID=3004091 RepID=UPI003D173788